MSLLSNYQAQNSGLTEPLVIPPIAPAPQPLSNAPELPSVPDAGALPELDPGSLPQDPLTAPFSLPPSDAPIAPNPVVPTFGDILYDIEPGNPWSPTRIPRATMPDDINNYIQPFLDSQTTPSQLIQNAFKPQMQGGNFNPFQWKFGDMGEGPLGALLYGLNLPFAAGLGLASDLARFNASQLEGFNNSKNNIGRRLRESGGNLLQLGRSVVKDFGDGFTQTQQATEDPSGMSFFTQALGGRAYSFSDDEYNEKGQLSPFAYITSKAFGVEGKKLPLAVNLPETDASKSIRGNKIIDAAASVVGIPTQALLNIPGISGSEPIKLPKLSDWTADRFKQAELTPEVFRKRVTGFALDAIVESLTGGLPKKIANAVLLRKSGVITPQVQVPLLSGTAPTQKQFAPGYKKPLVTLPGSSGHTIVTPPNVITNTPGTTIDVTPVGGRVTTAPELPVVLPDATLLDPRQLPGQPVIEGQPMLAGQGMLRGIDGRQGGLPGTPPRPVLPPSPDIVPPRPTLMLPPQRMVSQVPYIELNGIAANVVELRRALENLSDPPRITPETVQPQSFTARTRNLSIEGSNNITVNYIPGRNRAVMDWQNFSDFEDFSLGIEAMLSPRREDFLNDLDFDTALSTTEFIVPNIPTRFQPFFEEIGFSRMNDYTVGDGVPTNNFRYEFDPEIADLPDVRDDIAMRIENMYNSQLERQGRLEPGVSDLADLFRQADEIGTQYIEPPVTTTELFGTRRQFGLVKESVDGEVSRYTLTNPDKEFAVTLTQNSDRGGTGYDITVGGEPNPKDLYALFKEALQLDELKDKSFILDKAQYGQLNPKQEVRITSLLERIGFDVGWEFDYSRLDNYSTMNLAADILSPRSRRERFTGWRRNTRLAQIARFVDRPVQEFTNLRMEQIYNITTQIERSRLQDQSRRFRQDNISVESVAQLSDDDLAESISRAAYQITWQEQGAIARFMNANSFGDLLADASREKLIELINVFKEREIPIELEMSVQTKLLGNEAQYILDETRKFVDIEGGKDIGAFLSQRFPEIFEGVYSTTLRDIGIEFKKGIDNNLDPEVVQNNVERVLGDYGFQNNPEIQRLLNEITQPDVLSYDMAYREVQLSLPRDMRGSLPQTREAVQSLMYADTELETALRQANEVSQYLADIERPLEFTGAVSQRTIDPAMPLYLGTREVQAPLRMGDRLTNDLQQSTSQARRIVENPQELPYGSPEITEFSGGVVREVTEDSIDSIPELELVELVKQRLASLPEEQADRLVARSEFSSPFQTRAELEAAPLRRSLTTLYNVALRLAERGEPLVFTESPLRLMSMNEFVTLQEQLNNMREMLPEEMVDDTINQIYASLVDTYDILPDGTVINPDAFIELGRQSAPELTFGAGLRAEGYNAAPSEQTALDLQAQLVDDMQQHAEAAITAVDEAINRQALAEDTVRSLVEQEREMRFGNQEDNPRRLTEMSYTDDYLDYLRRQDARMTVHRSVQTPSRVYARRWEDLLDTLDDALSDNNPDALIEAVIRFRNTNAEMFDQLNDVYEDYASLFMELNRRQGQWLPSDLFPLLNEICS